VTPHRIVLIGATGQVGSQVAAALIRARARPLLVGRSGQDLAALGARLGHGLPTATVDLEQPTGLRDLLVRGDVVVNAAAPFSSVGRPVVEAAIARRARYLDCNAEPAFQRAVFDDYDVVARQVGTALMPGIGHAYVAGNLAAFMALEGLGEDATRVDIGYLQTGSPRNWVSRGMRRSRAEVALTPQFAWRGGELIATRFGDRVAAFTLDGAGHHGTACAGSEHITLPRLYPSIVDVGVYRAVFSSARSARVSARRTRRASRLPGGPTLVRWAAARHRPGEGFSASPQPPAGAAVIATVFDSQGKCLRRVKVWGSSAQVFTTVILAWAALRTAAGDVRGHGALGPVEAFGLCRLRNACTGMGIASCEISPVT
jgi:hypothetical protein